MTEQEVIDLMSGSKSSQEWNRNCDVVKRTFSGYPTFWYEKILASGVYSRTAASWGELAGMTLQAFNKDGEVVEELFFPAPNPDSPLINKEKK